VARSAIDLVVVGTATGGMTSGGTYDAAGSSDPKINLLSDDLKSTIGGATVGTLGGGAAAISGRMVGSLKVGSFGRCNTVGGVKRACSWRSALSPP